VRSFAEVHGEAAVCGDHDDRLVRAGERRADAHAHAHAHAHAQPMPRPCPMPPPRGKTSCAGFLGCLAVALTVDRVGRRHTVTWRLGGAALSLLLLGLFAGGSASGVLIWTSLSAVFFFGAGICLYLYTPELFPTRIRALGTSVGGAVNRLGVILGPIVVGAVYAGSALGTVFVTLAAVALVGAVTAGVAAEETAGQRLEDVAP
jgi:putative MFS transporter